MNEACHVYTQSRKRGRKVTKLTTTLKGNFKKSKITIPVILKPHRNLYKQQQGNFLCSQRQIIASQTSELLIRKPTEVLLHVTSRYSCIIFCPYTLWNKPWLQSLCWCLNHIKKQVHINFSTLHHPFRVNVRYTGTAPKALTSCNCILLYDKKIKWPSIHKICFLELHHDSRAHHQ